MRIDPYVKIAFKAPHLSFHVRKKKARSVCRDVTHGRFSEDPDDSHSGKQARFVSLIIAEAGHQGTIELAERGDGKR
jgi:hypothetical protein